MSGKLSLIVNVIKGIGLKAADIGGTSDPYLILTLGTQTFKTAVVKKSLDPVWNENFLFEPSDQNQSLVVRCLDKDLLKDDKIGDVTIPLSSLTVGQETIQSYKLLNVTKGEIQLGLTLEVDNSPPVEDLGTVSVRVFVKSATNLEQKGTDLPSTYAIIYLGESAFKTKKIPNSLNPVWDCPEYRWTLNNANEKVILPVCVYNKKQAKKDEFLGLALVPLAGIKYVEDDDLEDSYKSYKLHGVASGEILISVSASKLHKTGIPITDPTISSNELARKEKFCNQFIKMSQNSQSSGLKKFGLGFSSFLGIALQFVVDNSEDIGGLLGDLGGGGEDD